MENDLCRIDEPLTAEEAAELEASVRGDSWRRANGLLCVGDVLTADDPEPPVGTVVEDKDGNTLVHEIVTGWNIEGSEASGWMAWVAFVGEREPLTVVKVGTP